MAEDTVEDPEGTRVPLKSQGRPLYTTRLYPVIIRVEYYLIHIDNLREVADRHPGVRREREARKRGPRHRFWPSAAVCRGCRGCGGCRGLRFRVGGVTKIEDRRPKTAIPRGRGRKSGRSDAAKRPFRVGGATKSVYRQPPDRPPLAAATRNY